MKKEVRGSSAGPVSPVLIPSNSVSAELYLGIDSTSRAASLIGGLMASRVAEAGARERSSVLDRSLPWAERASLMNESWRMCGLQCLTQFQQVQEALGPEELHRLMKVDVREPLDIWLGLIAVRIIAAFLGCRPVDAALVLSKVSLLLSKLCQALEELWSAESLQEFLMNRGLSTSDHRMLHFVCV